MTKKKIFALLGGLQEMALLLSSVFFLTLLIVLPAAKWEVSPEMGFYVFFGLVMLYWLLSKKSRRLADIFLLMGSLAFFLFFLSNFFIPEGTFAKAYRLSAAGLESILNRGMLGIFVEFVILFLGFWVLKRVLDAGGYLLRKATSPLAKKVVSASMLIITVGVIGLLFISSRSRQQADLSMRAADYLAPILGFSLVYLHANELARALQGWRREEKA